MESRCDLLRAVMLSTSTTQSELARMSGVRQPSISQFLTGRVDFSDEQIDRLLSCMGFRLEVVRHSVVPDLTRSERRSWLLHRALSRRLTQESLESWMPMIEHNLERLRAGVQGQPHRRNLARWSSLLAARDINGLKRMLTGLDRDAIEAREVSPWSGLLNDDERRKVLSGAA